MTQRTTVEQARSIEDAWDAYIECCRRMANVQQCDSQWPPDPRRPGYIGTRCDLLDGHADQHRHRVTGSAVVVTW